MTNEKEYYKLADYFCTIGIDDYYTMDEVHKKEEKKRSKTFNGATGITAGELVENSEAASATFKNKDIEKEQIRNMDFPSIDDDIDFN